ncbi:MULTISPECIES: XdhC/CoxI family protein [Lacrimispora]|jgi:xanthine dehydrogenase accessory factor|uniref:XdhC family protein n=1 Tax=Lacrimispora TaxID=2719231 RepID=UPI000BE40775|nr:XdhC/CoxI family protein [Lacrimispora amygdalina]MDK2965525.1 xanthine dehydrogenase accessory factor [Lacrimispora sp.]
MRQLFREVLSTLLKGEDAVLVTIIASSGSTPRGTGSHMLVRQDGTTAGTIGGGAVEFKSVERAEKAIKDKCSYTHGFVLGKEQVADLGMICGGDVVVYFQYLDHEDLNFQMVCREIDKAFDRDEDSWLIMDITDETAWGMGIYNETGFWGIGEPDEAGKAELLKNKSVQISCGGRRYYSEPLVSAGCVYIFGGGHVAQEIVPVLAHLGFKCVVFDDREEFANRTLFPAAENVITGDYQSIFNYLEIRECDYVCIMTRGHQSDYVVQRQVLTRNACYVGVIGSRKKLASIKEKLMADGISGDKIDSCHSPIGLEIYAETPAEIAISVAGELISVRAGREGRRR